VRERILELRSRLANRSRERSNAYVVPFRRLMLEGDAFFLPRYALHRPACREFLEGRLYEPDTHALVAKLFAERRGDMIHAGTFFGDMLPAFSRACQGTVYAFEPVLENYVLAKLCVETNKLRNVALFNAALGAGLEIGHVDAGTSLHRGGASEISDHGQTTTIMPIDGLGLSELSVLHLDVEGYELPTLKGAESTLRRCRPTVLIEDYKSTCSGFLETLDYVQSGEVPGLAIWVHRAKP
jgi:FkbM family methyltransferase